MRFVQRRASTLEDFDQDETPAATWTRLWRGRSLRRRLRRGWWRSVKQTTCMRDIVGARVVGEEAVVANAMKAVGQDVEQKAADEFIAVERHEAVTFLALTPIVFPFEADAASVEGDKPAVGDGDAVGVARQIRQHLIRSCERALGVDDPIGAMERLQECAKRIDVGEVSVIAEELERTVAMSGDEALQHQAPKQPREHAHRQKEIGPTWNPTFAVRRNAAAGDDAMHVRVMGERRAPGVQHHGDAELGAEMFGIGAMVSSASEAALNSAL